MHKSSLKNPILSRGLKKVFVRVALIAGLCAGCATKPVMQEKPKAQDLDSSVSLKADRERLDALRKEEPKDIRSKNDEEAKYLEWMDGKNKPEAVREKFSKWSRELRDDFNKRSRELRDRYSAAERENRDSFTKSLQREREGVSKSWKADRRKRFFEDQEVRRKKFFAEERDQRAKFESEIRGKTHDFKTSMEEKRQQFYERLKDYTERMRAQPVPSSSPVH